MHFLKPLLPRRALYPRPSIATRLEGARVILCMGESRDWKAWRYVRDMSRDFLVPWEPLWPEKALSYGFYCGLLRRYAQEWRRGDGYNFHVFVRDVQGHEVLAGGIALTSIERGIAQVGTLGYWMGQPFTGRGYMFEATSLVLDYAFNTLRLHRVQAACMPSNEPSINLLRKLGFEEEGYAKSYLQINGMWEDHILWAKLRPNG